MNGLLKNLLLSSGFLFLSSAYADSNMILKCKPLRPVISEDRRDVRWTEDNTDCRPYLIEFTFSELSPERHRIIVNDSNAGSPLEVQKVLTILDNSSLGVKGVEGDTWPDDKGFEHYQSTDINFIISKNWRTAGDKDRLDGFVQIESLKSNESDFVNGMYKMVCVASISSKAR